jgi:phage terminase large subunit-like protein
MEILSDSTKTKVVHTRVITLSNAPKMKSNNYYYPEEMWQPEQLTVEWYDDKAPVHVIAEGKTDRSVWTTRSYSMDRIPEWIAKVVNPESVREPDLVVKVNPREVISVPKPEAPAPLVKPKLTRKRVGDRKYEIVTKDGALVATVAMTGEYSRDSYPWEWHVTDELTRQLKEAGAPDRKSGGSSDSLGDVVDMLATSVAKYNLKP